MAGLRAHGARRPILLQPGRDDEMYDNPTRRVRFRFHAINRDQALERAEEEFFQAGLRSGVAAVPAESREFGWSAMTEVLD